jgi:hypothetical protein
MLEIKHGDEIFELRNTPDELTLNEFDMIFSTVNRLGKDTITKYFEVFEFLKVPDLVLDSLDQEEFINMVKNFNDYQLPNVVPKEVVVNKRTYTSFEGDEFIFKARDISLIEQAQLKNDGHFPSWVVAILFKDVELTNTEHRDWTHIKHKAEQFRKHLTAAEAAPFMVRVVRRQLNELEEATDEKA